MAATVQSGLLVAMFQAMLLDRTAAKKQGHLQAFLDHVYGASSRDDYFRALRLVLPGHDHECCSYRLKVDLVAALGIAKDSLNALLLTNWSCSGGGCNTRKFGFVATEVLKRR